MHGSKKFIIDHTGKLKRSRHRTKEDFYGSLRWWDESGGRWVRKHTEFCPQCKRVLKALHLKDEVYTLAMKEIKDEWEALELGSYCRKLGNGKTQYFYEFAREHPKFPGILWVYHDNSYLCPKHQNWLKAKYAMWDGHAHGEKSHYWFGVRQERRKYRAQSKQKLRNGEYDIPPYKKNWLD